MPDVEEKEVKLKKRSTGSIVAIILVSVLISIIIMCSFLLSANQFVISKAIITLLCLLVILVLSNSFEHIHFGEWFELSNRVKEGNEKINQIKEKNDAIYSKIFTMNFQNTQAETVNNNYYQVKETDPTIQKTEQEEEKKINNEISKTRLNISVFRYCILDKYYGVGLKEKLQKNMSLVESDQNLDPISNRSVSFDALLEEDNKKTFIDVLTHYSQFIDYYRLYVKLNKILSYKKASGINVSLLVLIPRNEELDKLHTNMNAVLEKTFGPAIDNNILRIEYVDYSKEEYDSCLVKKRN